MATAAPPQVPVGWRAEWSGDHNTWYYLNLTTQVSQWDYPTQQAQGQYSAPVQQHDPYSQQQPVYTVGTAHPSASPDPLQGEGGPVGPDGERGLGKIAAGGLLGVAGGLLAGAIFNHEKDEHKNKKHHTFDFWNNKSDNDNSQGGPTSWFSNLGGGGQADVVKPAMATGGGFFGSMASHMPSMPGTNTNFSGGGAPYQAATLVPQQVPSWNTGNAPPLHIHCAAFADQDVTHIVRRMVTPSQSVEFNTDDMVKYFGDPWPGNKKQFSVLYSYGQRPWELVATTDNCGQLLIIPHQPLDKVRMEFVQPQGRILAVVWGRGNGLEGGKGKIEKLKEIETTGEFQATNDWMGFDGWCGPAKTAITYYREANGQVKIATAREPGTCRLPWNPLARWN